MKIRPMTTEDFDEVYALWKTLPIYLSPYDDEKEEVISSIKHNSTSCFVAVEEGKIIGGVLGVFDGVRGWVHHLAIDEKYQKNGYGDKLLQAAEEALKARGAKRIMLFIQYKNLDKLPFYLKRGFVPFHEALLLRKLN